MIRLQFEMAELDRFDSARQKLRRRELKLLKVHDVFGQPPRVAKVIGHRGGFADAVEITVTRFLKLQDELFASAPIRAIRLTGRSQQFDKIRESPWLSQLSTLVLWKNDASIEELINLITCPRLNRLQRLEIVAPNMNNTCAEELAAAPNLRTVEELVLRADRLNHDACRAIAHSSVLRNLRTLHLPGRQNNRSLSALASSQNCEHLEDLLLDGWVSDSGVQAIQNGPYCRHLKSLTLRMLTSNTESTFAVPSPLPELRRIKIFSTGAYDNGRFDSALPGLTDSYANLETLDLSMNGITTAGARVLAGSPILEKLKKLVLSRNRLTVEGVEAIAESIYYHKGLNLNVRYNDLSATEIRDLKHKYGKSFGNLESEDQLRWRR